MKEQRAPGAAAPEGPAGAGGLARLVEVEERLASLAESMRAEASDLLERARAEAREAEEALEPELRAEEARVRRAVRAALEADMADAEREVRRRVARLDGFAGGEVEELAARALARLVSLGAPDHGSGAPPPDSADGP